MALTPEGPGTPDDPGTREVLVTSGDVRAGLAVAALLAALGVPLGVLWAAVTPRAELAAAMDGLRLVDGEDKAFIAADGTFFLLTLAVGLLLGVPAWLLGRRHAIGVVVGLVVGAAAGAALALEAGQLFDARLGSFTDGTREAAEGVPLTLPNELLETSEHSRLLALAWPAGTALSFAAMALWRIGPAPERTASWGSPVPARAPGWEPPAGPAGAPPPA